MVVKSLVPYRVTVDFLLYLNYSIFATLEALNDFNATIRKEFQML